MKIQIIKNNITDNDTFNAGVTLVKLLTQPVFPLDISIVETSAVFTGEYFSNSTVGHGTCVNEEEILAIADKSADIPFLIFDASKVIPNPTNPVCSFVPGSCIPCQMSSQWYVTYPNTFAIYFLHEICHMMYWVLGLEAQDMTHLMTDRNMNPTLYDHWARHSLTDYYLSIIEGLTLQWNAYKASQNKPMQTLKIGSVGNDVTTLQNNLSIFGFSVSTDGVFGPMTEKAVADFQEKYGLVSVDGKVGPLTQTAIQTALIITQVGKSNDIEPELLLAIAVCEGGLSNPNITRQNTDTHKSTDRGVFQWNSYWDANITDAQAFDVVEATQFVCDAIKDGNLVLFWHLSEPCWSTRISSEIKQKYAII